MQKRNVGISPAVLVAAARGLDPMQGLPGAIEASEKMGQIQLVRSTNMPLDLSGGKEAFEKVGFTFGEKIDECFHDGSRELQINRGSFFQCKGGWMRYATPTYPSYVGAKAENDESSIIVLKPLRDKSAEPVQLDVASNA